jgi:hypothetical protein
MNRAATASMLALVGGNKVAIFDYFRVALVTDIPVMPVKTD